MPVQHHIRNPFELGVENATDAIRAIFRPHPRHAAIAEAPPQVRRLTAHDVWQSLREGLGDLGAYRSDILFIGIIYPLAGLILAEVAYGKNLIPMVFPLASGFALIGPVAALGLYEISLRREQGQEVRWQDAFGVFRAPGFPAIVRLSLAMVALFAVWMGVAYQIYMMTIGSNEPRSIQAFLDATFYTPGGWTMIGVGCAVGFVFAAVAFAISAVSFPLLLEHDVSVRSAVQTSVDVVRANPAVMALWGMIIAGSLILGSLPVLAGLIVVVPLLGHATWRLYRRAVTYE